MQLPIDIHAPRYKRRGKCKQCGWCCDNEDCEHLSYIDDRAICAIHPSVVGEETRPPKCNRFPQAPPILSEKCGFYFLDLWENLRPVKPGEI